MICPAVCFGMITSISDRNLACIISGAVLFLINAIFMIISYYMNKKIIQEKVDDDECPGCFSKRGYLFLFPTK